MKKLFLLILTLCVSTSWALAQTETLNRASSFEAYRPLNESRVWNFEIEKQNIGSLTSTVTGKKSIDGIDGYVIDQSLSLDFRKAGTELTMQSTGKQYLASNGAYLGCDLELDISGQKSTIEIRRDGDRLEATVEADGGNSESAEVFPRDGFGFEVFYVDLIEAYLAMRGAEVGETIDDTLYAVQSMLPVSINALCLDFRNVGLYTNRYDSVFIINVSMPENYRLHINRTGHLVKVDMPDRKLKIYQDYAGPARQAKNQEPGFTVAGLLRALPVTPVYFGFGAIIVSLLAWRGWRHRDSYMAFAGGFVSVVLLPGTLHLLQKLVVDTVVLPAAQKGESLYILTIFPALLTGLFMTAFIAVLLLLWSKYRPVSHDLSAIGAFLGAGMAVAESVYVATTIPAGFLFSLMLLERAAYVILLAVVGALIGRAMERGTDSLVRNLVAVVAIVTGFKYLPVLVQRRLVELDLMYIVSLLLAVVLLGVALILLARSKVKTARSRGGGHS